MENSLLIIIFILLFSGILGGWVNFYMQDEQTKKSFIKSILTGLTASLIVPLFLKMISSNLLEQIHGSDSKGGDPLKIFELVGFCLVAAIYSRKFIQNIYDRLMNEIKKSEEKTEKKLEEAIEPYIVKETEIDKSDEVKDLKDDTIITELSKEQRNVLEELAKGNFVLRSISGIAKATNIEINLVKKSINELTSKGLVRRKEVWDTRGDKAPRFFITLKGKAIISNINTE